MAARPHNRDCGKSKGAPNKAPPHYGRHHRGMSSLKVVSEPSEEWVLTLIAQGVISRIASAHMPKARREHMAPAVTVRRSEAPSAAAEGDGSGSSMFGVGGTSPDALLECTGEFVAHTRSNLLVADDDAGCRTAVRRYFEPMEYNVTEAVDGPSALHAVFEGSTDLMILDLRLAGVDGTQVLTKIRRDSSVPVIVFTGRDSEVDRIRMLNLGADDYLVKPSSLAELEARVRAVLRRGRGVPVKSRVEHGELGVDREARTVTLRGVVVGLTRKEFDLLAFLAAAPHQVFSRLDLLERVWGSTEQWQGQSTVTEHVRRIRLKIEDDSDRPRWITTVRGIGYRFGAPRLR